MEMDNKSEIGFSLAIAVQRSKACWSVANWAGSTVFLAATKKPIQQVVETICEILDLERPRSNGTRYRDLINFVPDRPGHDRRYAMDCSKIEQELGWRAKEHLTAASVKPSIGLCKILSGWQRRPRVPIATGLKTNYSRR